MAAAELRLCWKVQILEWGAGNVDLMCPYLFFSVETSWEITAAAPDCNQHWTGQGRSYAADIHIYGYAKGVFSWYSMIEIPLA